MSFGRRWGKLNPYDLHKTLINEYLLVTGGKKTSLFKRDTSNDKRDIDVIRENHQFLWDEEDAAKNLSWEKQLAKRYYDKLFKEYCVGDLSRYKENKIGLRWRTQQEVIDGKGQFSCGSKRCLEKNGLRSWEVNFGYIEHGIKKNALVKLRLCSNCSRKLNYHHKKKEVKRLKCKGTKAQIPTSSSNSSHSVSNKTPEKEDYNQTEKELLEKTKESQIWTQTTENEEQEKSREEEFDEYLSQLFL